MYVQIFIVATGKLTLSFCRLHTMGTIFRALHACVYVWLTGGVGAFGGVGMPTLPRSRRPRIHICSSSEQSGLTGNDAARKALEQASKLRQEAADLEKELAKGKPKLEDDNTQEPSTLLPDVPSSPFSLAPSRWLVMMDIGREKGTWMPQNWGISGRRVEVDLLVQFLPGGEMEATVDSPFVDMTVTPGRWNVGSAEGRNRRRRPDSLGSLTSDTCRFWVETDGFARGDVTIPAGKLYFAVPAWGGKLSRKGIVTVRKRRFQTQQATASIISRALVHQSTPYRLTHVDQRIAQGGTNCWGCGLSLWRDLAAVFSPSILSAVERNQAVEKSRGGPFVPLWLVREESRILGIFGTELLVPDAEGRLPPRMPRPRTPPFPDGFRNG